MGGWPVGYLHRAQELNSGPPKTNPSRGREDVLNTVPPDYKSSALPLGHARLVPQDPLNRLLQFLFLIYLLVTSYCFIIVAVVIVLGLGAFFLLCVLSKTIEPLNLRPYENCHPITEINATSPCSQTQISTPRPIFVDLNLGKMCNEMCQKHNENHRGKPNCQILNAQRFKSCQCCSDNTFGLKMKHLVKFRRLTAVEWHSDIRGAIIAPRISECLYFSSVDGVFILLACFKVLTISSCILCISTVIEAFSLSSKSEMNCTTWNTLLSSGISVSSCGCGHSTTIMI